MLAKFFFIYLISMKKNQNQSKPFFCLNTKKLRKYFLQWRFNLLAGFFLFYCLNHVFLCQFFWRFCLNQSDARQKACQLPYMTERTREFTFSALNSTGWLHRVHCINFPFRFVQLIAVENKDAGKQFFLWQFRCFVSPRSFFYHAYQLRKSRSLLSGFNYSCFIKHLKLILIEYNSTSNRYSQQVYFVSVNVL